MKKTNMIILFAFLIFFISSEVFSQNIYFNRDGYIWVADTTSKSEVKLFEGTNPQISPDGKFIAFTHNEFTQKSLERYIGIYNVLLKEKTILKDIPGIENFGPKWSPDSKYILFNHKNNGVIQAAIVFRSGKGFKILSGGFKEDFGIGGWKSDSKTALFYDKKNLFEVDLDGEITNKFSLKKLLGNYDYSEDMNFQFFQKDKVLIFTALNDDDFIEGYVYAPSVLFIYDFVIGTPFRITPKGLNVTAFSFMDDKNIIIFSALTSETIRKGIDNIYSIDTRGHNLELILENGMTPSFYKK